jgi:hypothetical protein
MTEQDMNEQEKQMALEAYHKYCKDKHRTIIKADWLAAWEARGRASAQPDSMHSTRSDDTKVICPECCHQFRAIPVQVQRLMLDAGFEPPFAAKPAPVTAEGWIPISDQQPPFNERLLAQIEYLSGGVSVVELVVCTIQDNGDLETDAGDDVGWSHEAITYWQRAPIPVGPKVEE